MTLAPNQREVSLRLVNPRKVVCSLILEPWGESFAMPGGAAFDVIACGPQGDGLEIAFESRRITVWGWPGSVVRVMHHGIELGAGARPPVPGVKEAQATHLPSPPRARGNGRSPRGRRA